MTKHSENKTIDWKKRFRELWARIEKTMTGHISGRHIWDADTQGNDDEANYLYVDETLEQFIQQELDSALKERTESLIEELEFRLIDNRISPYDEKFEIMKADIQTVKSKYLKQEEK